jgi:hypothetical protein
MSVEVSPIPVLMLYAACPSLCQEFTELGPGVELWSSGREEEVCPGGKEWPGRGVRSSGWEGDMGKEKGHTHHRRQDRGLGRTERPPSPHLASAHPPSLGAEKPEPPPPSPPPCLQ